MPGMLVRWLTITIAVLIVPKLFSGVRVDDVGSALIAAAILGILNASIRPLLILLTLPLTVVSLGFFVLVINALLFMFVGSIVPGFHVDSFWSAFFASLVVSLVSWIVSNMVAGGPGERTVIVRKWGGNAYELRRGRGGRWE
jgi:putative membrane protein